MSASSVPQLTSSNDSKDNTTTLLTFKLSEYDLGNTPIIPDPPEAGRVSFAFQTERSFMDVPKMTTLTMMSFGSETIVGVIDWKKKTMEVEGKTKPVAELKKKIGGTLSLTHEWTWSINKYVTSTKNGVWTAKHGEKTIAVLTPLRIHPFKKDELHTLTFYADLSIEEMVFLMLILAYPDLKLPPQGKPPGFGEVAGNTAATAAGNVAVNGISTCCSIQ